MCAHPREINRERRAGEEQAAASGVTHICLEVMLQVFVKILGNQQFLTFFKKEIISSINLINNKHCDSKRK